jgi:DUF1365 family protein
MSATSQPGERRELRGRASVVSRARFRSALYRGELLHARHDALARRVFRYGVYMAALELDELPALDRDLRLFSHRGRNVFSFDERDYAAVLSPSRTMSREPRERLAASRDGAASSRGGLATSRDSGARSRDGLATSHVGVAGARDGLGALRDGLAALRAANGLPAPATTRLVTNLRTLGYGFNPVSFFLDYDARGALTSVIAEVNNTYGGRLRYVLGPAQRLDATRVGFRHVRELFVSPFLHGEATYDFWFDAPLDGDAVAIEMHVHRGAPEALGSRLFTARLTGARTALSDRALLAAALRYPLMSVQVIGLIHLEALRLRLAGVPYRRPAREHRPLGE